MDPAEARRVAAGWWRDFGVEQCRGYSPLYERICEAVSADDEVLDLVLAAPPAGRQPNVLLAAAHDLLLRGVAHPLAAVYRHAAEGGEVDPDAGALFCDLVRSQRAEVAELLATRRTNTNECGRASVLVPGLRWIAERIGEPLALLDAGTSAGLNLRLDRYRIDYDDGRSTGPADATVRIACGVQGVPPVRPTAPAIAARAGLDRAPVDLDDGEQVRWLLACTWPDTGRLPRTEAALALARRHPVEVVRGDLVDDLDGAVALLTRDAPLVVMTSWVVAYLARHDRRRFDVALARLSSGGRVVAWLSAEAPGVVDHLPDPDRIRPATRADGVEPSVLGVTHYRDGARAGAEVLARCHPHGAWLEWLAS